MTEQARVQEINGNSVTVSSGEPGSCFGCMKIECRSRCHVYTAGNPHGFLLKTGQLVEIEKSAPASIQHAVLLFLPLLLGFLGGYILASVTASSSEAGRAAAGAAGLITVGLANFFYRKRYPLLDSPRISRIIEET